MNKLIRTIELLNEKSVVFGIDNSRSNLWILMHFKNLKLLLKKYIIKSIMVFIKEKTQYTQKDGLKRILEIQQSY